MSKKILKDTYTIGATENFTVRGSSSDPNPGFLDAKVDGVTIMVNNNDQLAASGVFDTYKVKASDTDPIPGYLDAKIDGTTIRVVDDKMHSFQSQWYEPKIDGLTYLSETNFSVNGDRSDIFSPNQRLGATLSSGKIFGTIRWIEILSSPVTTKVFCNFDNNVSINNTLSKIELSLLYGGTVGSIPVPRMFVLNSSMTLSNKYLNSTIEMFSDVDQTISVPGVLTVPIGTWNRFINGSGAMLTVSDVVEQKDYQLLPGEDMTLIADANHWKCENGRLPSRNAIIKESSYVLTLVDACKILEMRAAVPSSFTLLQPDKLPSGSWEWFINAGTADLTIEGLINGTMNRVLKSYESLIVSTDGILWFGLDAGGTGNNKVKASATDPTPGYLDAKVDGITVMVVDNKLMAPGGGEDTFTVKASFLDPTPGFLDDKVDGTTIRVVSDKLVATAANDTYTVKATSTDPTPGYLNAKVDNDGIKVVNDKLVLGVDPYKVRASSTDYDPGFLDSKVDNDTIKINIMDQLCTEITQWGSADAASKTGWYAITEDSLVIVNGTANNISGYDVGRRIKPVWTDDSWCVGTIISTEPYHINDLLVNILFDSNKMNISKTSKFIYLGPTTPDYNSIPILFPIIVSESFTITPMHKNKTIVCNPDADMTFVIPEIIDIPQGSTLKFINDSDTGKKVTLQGIISGLTNLTLYQGDEITLYRAESGGSYWNGAVIRKESDPEWYTPTLTLVRNEMSNMNYFMVLGYVRQVFVIGRKIRFTLSDGDHEAVVDNTDYNYQNNGCTRIFVTRDSLWEFQTITSVKLSPITRNSIPAMGGKEANGVTSPVPSDLLYNIFSAAYDGSSICTLPDPTMMPTGSWSFFHNNSSSLHDLRINPGESSAQYESVSLSPGEASLFFIGAENEWGVIAPRREPIALTSSKSITMKDVNRIYYATTVPITVTLPSTGIPYGMWIKVVNLFNGAGQVTISGTVSGVVNPKLNKFQEITCTVLNGIWTGHIVG